MAQFQQKHKIQLTTQNQAFVSVFAANILRHCPINLGNFALSVEACVQCPVLQGGVSQVWGRSGVDRGWAQHWPVGWCVTSDLQWTQCLSTVTTAPQSVSDISSDTIIIIWSLKLKDRTDFISAAAALYLKASALKKSFIKKVWKQRKGKNFNWLRNTLLAFLLKIIQFNASERVASRSEKKV